MQVCGAAEAEPRPLKYCPQVLHAVMDAGRLGRPSSSILNP